MNETQSEDRRRYDATMDAANAEWAPVLDALTARYGTPFTFTQTGGMCGAIVATLESGYEVMIFDQDDSLSWSITEHDGWSVGLYPPDEVDQSVAVRFLSTSDDDADRDSVDVLVGLVDQVLTRPTATTDVGK